MDTKYIQSPKASDFQYSFDQITVSMSQVLVPALHKSEDQPVYIDILVIIILYYFEDFCCYNYNVMNFTAFLSPEGRLSE